MIQSHWLDLLLSAGATLGIFITVVLWQKMPSNRSAVQYLASIILLLALVMLLRASYQPQMVQTFAEILLLPDAILFLIGPHLYFFTRSLLRLPLPETPRRWWHYLPAAIHVLVFNTVVGLHLNGTLSFLDEQQINLIFFLIEGGAIVSLVTYLWLSLGDCRHYRVAWEQQFSTPLPARLLQPFFITGFLLSACWMASFLGNMLRDKPEYTAYFTLWFVLVAYVFFLGCQILLHPEWLELPKLKTLVDIPQSVQDRVEKHMLKAKPHLDPALKIGDLADTLDMPKHELSKVLNHAFGKNFFDYVNAHRTQEFIALRNSPRHAHLHIFDLAFQAGFNSRTAFNRAFRKETGFTPSEFFKDNPQHNNELS
ncbi:MAG: AraC family transcriptional regulator [Saprospiraceae bacterium]|nr:AraC family transcriptional regulator [Saprospiraceae bacterium]MCF8248727.1 AraC family transcriptional regulator [Saprospiraceae bacterium]MCF8278783.1 AraC family transcriptional regulator [Bacteroidales bacterium]MCF8310583.1 AraC family transcriptional regulator [Saprospiraceae bacterium]MCF8439142.1 AraC family transcriptional regulator [Saprospiraceae bacterium]